MSSLLNSGAELVSHMKKRPFRTQLLPGAEVGAKTSAFPACTDPYLFVQAERVPDERPPFTIGDLKRVIPAHCFERSLFTSFRYLIVDVAVIAALYYSTSFFSHPSLPFFAPYILWPLYWLLQGYVLVGVPNF